ncbi:DNA mismatch repair protein [Pseudoflavitalea sp. G-6-1-2]|uniref:MutS-related protein n=1 Tax=Pseudoflavitalea sp. G-6-1-2 TaxID=2728841 RepID=UPI00146B0035|nr:DNA mismatch repair protein [Pseudoflavitalea sp. G-6-1-2]NML22396.1 DNA mismatch repair protein [Pseudoflavitalea sp. G-6-1-2]
MNFAIDKQSQDELNLTGKFRQGSVFHLFNTVKTRGGEQLLDEMFGTPLTNEHIINDRTAIFRYFQQHSLNFPFDAKQVTHMREYIEAGSAGTLPATWLNVMMKKTLSSITRDERYKAMIQGLQATIVTLQKCFAFAADLKTIRGPFDARIESIREILHSPELQPLLETDIYQSISIATIARYDHLLHNRASEAILDILRFIAETDVYIAVANVATEKGFGWARALPRSANMLKAAALKHPCISNATGNNIEMKSGSNMMFLTGANMAGKSTWMKSIGIALYLAHAGFPVAADEMEFSVRDGICSSINVADNIQLGYSHFYAEVVRVKNAAEATATGKHLLLMFDELFKGTNVKDAFDGTLAVAEAFAEYKNCLFIVSTHIIEVGESLKQLSNIQFTFMPTIMKGKTPQYTYQLQKGITEDRQGMIIIRNEGILDLINA